MRIANVIGRVTLSVRHHALRGERLLVVLPWSAKTGITGKDHDYSIVAHDELGAGVGQLVAIAESSAEVDLIVAHTLREENASVRILRRLGFQLVGEVIDDPADGPVWRWELASSTRST